MIRTLLIYLIFSATLAAQSLQPQNPIRFLALGDSYTIGQSVPVSQRWPVQLSDSLAVRGFLIDTLTIIATTGWRTDNLIDAVTNQGLQTRNYNFVSLLIGVNNQYQGRPFSQYITEFPALLDSAIIYAGGDKSHVFVVSIPDYAFTPYGQATANPSQISAELDEYNAFNRHIADSMQVTYFDITPISRMGIENPSYVAGDGLHPSGIQYTEWVKLMLENIDGQITGIETEKEMELSINPNPVSDLIQITINGKTNSEKSTLEIYNAAGSLISAKLISGNYADVSVLDFNDGLYLIKITSGKKQIVKRIIKSS